MTDLISITYQLTNFTFWIFILLLTLAAMAGVVYILVLFWRHRNREETSLNTVLLQVAMPRENEVKIDAAEQLFASLYAIRKTGFLSFLDPQPHITFELVGKKEDIRFYVAVEKKLQDLVEKQIFGAYPGVEVKEVDEYNIFSKTGKIAFASLKLKGGNYNPIKVYKDLATDPLSSITSSLAKMGDDEGCSIQILVSPTDKSWSHAGRSFISKTKKTESNPDQAKYNIDPKTYDAIENKCSKVGFEVAVRIVVSSSDIPRAKMHLDNIISAFNQFTSDLNGFTTHFNWLTKWLMQKMFMIDFIYRYFPFLGGKSILSSEELATIYHFPNKSVETPHIYWLNAKKAPAPQGIATEGTFIGLNKYRGQERKVYMTLQDRQRHMYIIGKTGTGKSKLLVDLIMQDIRAGYGVCAIDPHGDFIKDVLEMMPAERAEDVIYFNPADFQRPLGLNIMEAHSEEQKNFITSAIINLMYKLFDPNRTGIIGPRFEHAVRNAMLTVMYEEGATFVEVVRILTDQKYVNEILPKVTDPMIRRYWTDQIAQTNDFHKSEVLDYIASKFGRFVTDRMMRNMIGQAQSGFDFRKAMDEKKILLVNLSKGIIGEENSNFLGLILVPKILMAAMSRQDVAEEFRPDFFLYVDEFQNFATPDFAQILSEARKYHLNLIVANQFIGQIEESVKNAIFGNVGTIVSFRVGVTDANYLQHEFAPTFTETDLLNVEKYNIFIKTIVKNEPVPPFTIDLAKDLTVYNKLKNPKLAEMIIQLSRLKYGRDRELVEAEIAQRARL
ncbi:type IV secretory system conjugative DNA transfer family protein [Candidatus Beckwithbacteria bacterium]|nr:type IV secretory system conjugative DNA transfer family protein [Candidatus Beckwithbacteria bacterium]